jgi:phospholipid transport system transporter-binding protein
MALLLQADCTLRQAAALKTSLLGHEADPRGAILDGSAVQRIDTAGLQLLVAFAQRQARAGRPLSWAAASPVLCEAGRRLGLAAVLSLPATQEAVP